MGEFYSIAMLSKNASIQIKGIAAIFIMVGHLLPTETAGIIRAFFYGPVWVGLFFFISGYGIEKKVQNGNGISREFLFNIIKKIWIPFAVAELIHLVVLYITSGEEMSVSRVIGSIFGMPLSNSVLWYVVELIILEMLFYVIYKAGIMRKMSLGITVWSVLFVMFLAISVFFDVGTWWYISTVTFLLGMFISGHEDILVIIHKKAVLVFLTLTSIILYFVERFTDVYNLDYSKYAHIPQNYFLTGLTMILVPVFTLTVIGYMVGVKGNKRILMFLGEISYYIYLYHIPAKYLVTWLYSR